MLDWIVLGLVGGAGFFLNEWLRNDLQLRGYDRTAPGLAIVVSATLAGGIIFSYVLLGP